jgi:osmoprotectant transport system substrate-binding protein
MTLRTTWPLVAIAAVVAVSLSACSTTDPLTETTQSIGDGAPIVVGSQDYYSNEIVAELYAQALESKGYPVDRQFRIGQREVCLPEIESGTIDLFPEYSGPLLQYWQPETTARRAQDVYTALEHVLPQGLRVLEQSRATDQDAYAVTRPFAQEWDLTSIADLSRVTVPLTIGGNSEGETRPNGPNGLKNSYGVDVTFTPIEDGGGPLTVASLKDGAIQLAIVYTADPSISKNDLVILDDPAGLFLASHVVPLASEKIDDRAAAVINEVSAALTPEALIGLNARSVDEQLPADRVAGDWLSAHHLI